MPKKLQPRSQQLKKQQPRSRLPKKLQPRSQQLKSQQLKNQLARVFWARSFASQGARFASSPFLVSSEAYTTTRVSARGVVLSPLKTAPIKFWVLPDTTMGDTEFIQVKIRTGSSARPRLMQISKPRSGHLPFQID